MATAIVSTPSAQVFVFPKARKRGPKMTKGPKASVHVIYEWDDTPEPAVSESPLDRMAALIADRVKRKEAEWASVLAANPNITEFPKEWRYRTLIEVQEHRRAHEGKPETALDKRMQALAEKVADKAKEILGGDAA